MPDIPWTYVTRLLSAAANAAEDRGIAVAIAVADAEGGAIGALRMTGAPELDARLALAKAYTAVCFRRDSVDVAVVEQDRTTLFEAAGELADQPLITTEGGVVIRDGDTVVGAVGVAGGTAEQTVEIARAALAAHPVGAWIGRG